LSFFGLIQKRTKKDQDPNMLLPAKANRTPAFGSGHRALLIILLLNGCLIKTQKINVSALVAFIGVFVRQRLRESAG
jgi:hypothetical protein